MVDICYRRLYFILIYLLSVSYGYAQVTCSEYPLEGFAAVSGEGLSTTTGGEGGDVIVVRDVDQLLAWASSREKNTTPEILHISGKILTTDESKSLITIKNGANISIYGINGGELVGIGLNIRDYSNVIVRNLIIHEVIYPNDGLTLDGCHHVWVDHNEFYSINGPDIGVDTYDGLFDIKKSSRFITASWNVFHDHKKVLLIGHTDTFNESADDTKMTITLHHNYFYNNDGRNPSLRFGNLHLYNNYFKYIFDYGIAVRQGAHALIENNVYEDVVLPIATDKFDGPEGFVCERGNIFNNAGENSITQTDCNFWNTATLPYTYGLTPTAEVASLIIKDAGICNNNADPEPVFPIVISNPMGLLDKFRHKDIIDFYNNANGENILEVELKHDAHVTINIYNTIGNIEKSIFNKTMTKGHYINVMDLTGLTNGIYICDLNIDDIKSSHKIVVCNNY